jgi:hypothetical protein
LFRCYFAISPFNVLLFNFEQKSFEVFPFGVVDAHWVVGGVRQLTHDTHLPTGIYGSREHHCLEVFLADCLAAAEGHQESTLWQRLHSTLVDGTVAFESGLQTAVVLCECRRVENYKVK